MSATNRIDVVIVNWNSGDLLKSCVFSCLSSAERYRIRVYVVDNSSSDGSADFIDGIQGVSLFRSPTNLGFAKGCNVGASFGTSDYILFLNPDARVLEPTIADSLVFLDRPESSNVGVLGVQLVDGHGAITRSCSHNPSPMRLILQSAGVDRVFRHLSHFMVDWAHDCTLDVDQVIGAYLIVRREVFDSLKGFDERFFVYFEEVDFSIRAKHAGWRVVYFAETQAIHIGGGTTNQIKASRLFYTLRSRLLFSFKHFDPLAATLVALAVFFIEPFTRLIAALASGSPRSAKETVQAYVLLFRWAASLLFNRSINNPIGR